MATFLDSVPQYFPEQRFVPYDPSMLFSISKVAVLLSSLSSFITRTV